MLLYHKWERANSAHWYLFSFLIDIVLECDLEDMAESSDRYAVFHSNAAPRPDLRGNRCFFATGYQELWARDPTGKMQKVAVLHCAKSGTAKLCFTRNRCVRWVETILWNRDILHWTFKEQIRSGNSSESKSCGTPSMSTPNCLNTV